MEILYPKRTTHNEMEMLMCNALRGAGLDARLEVRARGDKPGERNARLDLVVFRDKRAVCIVECKSWSQSYLRNQRYRQGQNSKQMNRYRETSGVPVFICGCLSAIEPVKQLVLSVYNR